MMLVAVEVCMGVVVACDHGTVLTYIANSLSSDDVLHPYNF